MNKSVYDEYKELGTQPSLEEKLSIGCFKAKSSGKRLANISVHNGDEVACLVSVDFDELREFIESFK